MKRCISFLLSVTVLTSLLLACSSDNTPPQVVSVFPVHGQSDTDCGVDITVVFSEAMNKSSVEKSFSISPRVEGAFTWSGDAMKFVPTDALLPATKYTIDFTQPAYDLVGQLLPSFTIEFTTRAAVGQAPIIEQYPEATMVHSTHQEHPGAPVVNYTRPDHAELNVDCNAIIWISFSETMNKSTVEKSFSISPRVEGAFSWSGTAMKFVPAETLLPATKYTIYFPEPVLDLSGQLLSDFSLEFTTRAAGGQAPITQFPVLQVPKAQTSYIFSYKWMPDSKGIVVLSEAYELYKISLDKMTDEAIPSSDGYRVTHLHSYASNMSLLIDVAYDGSSIVYTSGESEVSIYDLTQNEATHMADVLNYHSLSSPMLSPDGNKVAFLDVTGAEDGHSDVYQSVRVYDLVQGGDPITVSPPSSLPAHTDRLIGFDHDSTKLYVISTFQGFNWGHNFRYDLWEVDLATNEHFRLSTNGPIRNFLSSSKHPTLPCFVYGAWQEVEDDDFNLISFPTDIYAVELYPFKQTKLTSSGRNVHPAYSPDGSSIAYVADVVGTGEQWEVYTMSPDGSNQKQLTHTCEPKMLPQWSPDGSMISFVQIEDNVGVLYIMNADGTELRRVLD